MWFSRDNTRTAGKETTEKSGPSTYVSYLIWHDIIGNLLTCRELTVISVTNKLLLMTATNRFENFYNFNKEYISNLSFRNALVSITLTLINPQCGFIWSMTRDYRCVNNTQELILFDLHAKSYNIMKNRSNYLLFYLHRKKLIDFFHHKTNPNTLILIKKNFM